MSEQKRILTIQSQNEDAALQLLGWTETQVSQATHVEIATALSVFHKAQLAKKRELPKVTAPETIIILTSAQPQSQTPQQPQHQPSPHTKAKTPPASSIPIEQTCAPIIITQQQQQHEMQQSPKVAIGPAVIASSISSTSSSTSLTSSTSSSSSSFSSSSSCSLSKTPGFVRAVHQVTLTEKMCHELGSELKTLQKRRGEHEILLTNPHLDEINRKQLEESCARTNQYIRECLERLWLQKEQTVSALESKRSLLGWTNPLTDPEAMVTLTKELSQLSLCLAILNQGLQPA